MPDDERGAEPRGALLRSGEASGVHVIAAANPEGAVADLAGDGGVDTLRMRPSLRGSLGAAEYSSSLRSAGLQVHRTDTEDLDALARGGDG